jgi:ABC-type multidrug transport system fused ATPase/permease subunit
MTLDNMKALLKQEIGFFEQEGSSSGGLASSVSVHPANIGAVTGLVSTQSIVILVNLTGAVVMGLALDWKTAIVGLPLIFVLFVSVSHFRASKTAVKWKNL